VVVVVVVLLGVVVAVDVVEVAVVGAAVEVVVVVAVEVDDEWFIIFEILWQPPSVSISAAAHMTTEIRIEISP